MPQREKMKVLIKGLSLENFKCFKKEQSFEFKRLTVLTGANSSGKSSILYGILGMLQSEEFPIHYSLNGEYVNMGGFKEISNKHNSKNKITIKTKFVTIDSKDEINVIFICDRNKKTNLPSLNSIEFKDDLTNILITKSSAGGEYELNFTYSNPKLKERDLSVESDVVINYLYNTTVGSMKESGYSETRWKHFFDSMIQAEFNESLKIPSLENILKSINQTDNGRLLNSYNLLTNVFKDFNNNVNYISSQRNEPERTYLEESKSDNKVYPWGQGYLDQIIYWENNNPEKIKQLNAIMKKFKLIQKISTKRLGGGRYDTLVKTKHKSITSSLSDVGFGISQILPIIVADLQLEKNSTLFISQPEIHLHPSVQADFADYLLDQMARNEKNYIVETHSEYFLNRLRFAIAKGVIKNDDLSVYYLENDGNDVKSHSISFGKEGQIKGAPDSFFDTYLTDVRNIALNAFE